MYVLEEAVFIDACTHVRRTQPVGATWLPDTKAKLVGLCMAVIQ